MRFTYPDSNRAPNLEGQVLAASPRMDDPRFFRSVVLVLHHGEQGALGIVLNRPMSLAAAHKDLKSLMELGPKLFQGGPVGGSLIALQWSQLSAKGGASGSVFMVQKPEDLNAMDLQGNGPLRLFLGHAGWTGGQLEGEIAEGWWYPMNALPQLLQLDGQEMWVEAIRNVGREFYREVLRIDRLASDPQLN